MKGIKRLLSLGLAFLMLLGLMPMEIIAAEVNDPGYLEISDGYLSVRVSKDNGGFLIDTVEGNKLKKSDDNKFLLYPDEDFDTSFTSFRVMRDGETKDYIFGRDYGFLGLNSSEVDVTSDGSAITATWSVDGLEFTQIITLLDLNANQHGMAYITYQVKNTGSDADIQARILMDTALGYQDYAIYELTQNDGSYDTIETEKVLGEHAYNTSFFAYDNEYAPSVMAYIVDATVNGNAVQPTKTAFGHWNNLAATVYDFVPNEKLTFTNLLNDYLTADSAFALYYDMGKAASGGEGTAIGTYYGVYSYANADTSEKVAINFEMPDALTLVEDGSSYKKLTSDESNATFDMNIRVTNISEKTITHMAVALYPENKLYSYDAAGGNQNLGVSAENPYFLQIIDLIPGEERVLKIPFGAEVASSTQYRKIGVRCFDLEGQQNLYLLEEKVIGERDAYVLCPGGIADSLVFTGMTPEAVYTIGTRSLFITGTNFTYLRNQETYNVILRPMDGRNDVVIPDSNVFVDTNENTMELVLTQELTDGTWQVIIDWEDSTKIDTTSDALRFVVGDNPAYKMQSYGVLVIEQNYYYDEDTNSVNKYRLKAFTDEADYESEYAKADMDTVLMEFRGSFSLTFDKNNTIIGAKATALEGGDSINISNCLDVDNGTLEITVEDAGSADQEILVDIDGEVYTTGARTKVWSGVCALSTISNKTILSKYDKWAKHLDTTAENSEANKDKIMLCWPGAASGAQTLAGMVMEFRYAEFGRMYLDEGSKYVISFGAEVNPDFLVPNTFVKEKTDAAMTEYRAEQLRLQGNSYLPREIRDVNERHREDIQKLKSSSGGSFAIGLHDILFGGGFIGVNSSVELEIPSYTQGMPELAGTLNIRIIGEEWAMRMEGSADFIVFEMEGSLGLKSYNSVPVPDELYFFMGGVTPGVNVDGMGIFWIRGLGGGIKDVYNTIFTASSLPPLTILFKGQFALFSVLSATVELEASARGISLDAKNLGFGDISIIQNIGTSIYWYPKIRFNADIRLNMFDIINGAGSLMLEEMEDEDGETYFFWEGFANVGIQVPDWVPFIPGLQIASVDLGVNPERLWGALHILQVDAGVTYYWGNGDVEFAFGKYDAPEPTVSTFRVFNVPMYSDPGSGEVLYMSMYALSEGLTKTQITTTPAGNAHTFTLAENAAGTEDAMITVQYAAATEDEARSIFTVTCGDEEYPLKWMQGTDTDAEVNKDANAIFSYKDGKATVTFTVSEEDYFGKEFNVSTGNASAISIYGMPRRASLDSIEVTDSTAALTGDLAQLSEVSIYADGGDGISYLLYDGAPAETVTLTYPEIMPTGTYTIRAIGKTEDESANPIAVAENIEYVNENTPDAPISASVALGGDYMLDVSVDAPEGDFDGYMVTVYEVSEDGDIPTSYENMLMDKNAEVLTVGGQYDLSLKDYVENNENTEDPITIEAEELTYGLFAGKDYYVGVRTYKNIGDQEGLYLSSAETYTDVITMPEADKPEVSMKAEGTVPMDGADYIGKTETVVTITSDQELTNCKYSLDGGEWIETDGSSITLTDLTEGGHRITLRGENAQGDGFESMYAFSVHATSPVLMIASPANGSTFTDAVTVSGITDPNGVVTVTSADGTSVQTNADAEGRFSAEITLDGSYAYQTITVQAENFVGNKSREISLTLTSEMLGSTDLRPVILLDGEEITNLTADANGKQLTFALKSIGTDRILHVNSDSSMAYRVNWEILNVSGHAVLSDTGVVSEITDESNGMITAALGVLNTGVVVGGISNIETSDLTLTWTEENGVITIMASAANGLNTLTVNGWTPEDFVPGANAYTYAYTVNYGGSYEIVITDAEGTEAKKTAAVEMPLTVSNVKSTNTVSEVSADGSVTISADSVTGGSYDPEASDPANNSYKAVYYAAIVPVEDQDAEADLTAAEWIEIVPGTDIVFSDLAVGWYRTAVKNGSDETVVSDAVYVGFDKFQIRIPTEIPGGSVKTENVLAEPGDTITIYVTPDDEFLLEELVIKGADGEPVDVVKNDDGSYSFTMPEGSVDVEAVFTEDFNKRINLIQPENAVVEADAVTAQEGQTVTVTVKPDNGYTFQSITVTDKAGNAVEVTDIGNGRFTFVMPGSRVDVSVAVVKSTSNEIIIPKLFRMTVSAAEGGTITPAGNLLIAFGASRTFRITPEEGYEIADVQINGRSVGAVEKYTVKAASEDMNIVAVFRKAD